MRQLARVIRSHLLKESRKKNVKLVSSSDSILPIPTFYQITTSEYYAKVDEMYKLLRTHKYIHKELQRQQEEFHTVNGFKAKLPDIQFVSYKLAMQMMKEQPSEASNEQRNNNNARCQDNQFGFLINTYVKTKDLSEKTNECFVKVKEGMVVKLKVATDNSEVAFGWYKTNPWNQKKWGFFRKSTEKMM